MGRNAAAADRDGPGVWAAWRRQAVEVVVAARYVDERTLVCTTPDVSHLCVEGPAAVQVSMLRPPRGERV